MKPILNFWPAAVILAGVWGGIFWLRSPLVPINYADSNDLYMAAVSGGLAHPPGYPLFTVTFNGWLKMIPGMDPYIVMKVGVIWLSVITFILLAAVARSWLVSLKDTKRRPQLIGIASLLVASFWMSLSMTWLNGVTFEVFSLGTLLALAGILILYRSEGRPLSSLYAGFGFLSGLAFWHHPLSAVITIGLVVSWRYKMSLKKQIQPLLFGTGMSLVVYGTIFWIASLANGYSWYRGSGLVDAIEFWLRIPYETGGSQIETYSQVYDPGFIAASGLRLLKILWLDMGVGLGLLVVIFGLIAKKFREFRLLIAWTGVAAVGLLIYLKFPPSSGVVESEFYWGTILRYRMYFGVLVAMLIGVSAGVLRVMEIMSNKGLSKAVGIVGGSLFLGLIMSAVWPMSKNDVRESNFSRVLAEKVLHDMPANSTLLVDTDMVLAVVEAQQTLAIRPDVRVEPLRFRIAPDDDLWHIPAVLSDDKRFTEVWPVIAALNEGSRVILLSPEAQVLEFLGEEGNPLYLFPFGYGLEITATPYPDIPDEFDFGISETFEVVGSGLDSWWGRGEQGWLAVVHTKLGYYATRLGMGSSLYHFRTAERLAEFEHTRDLIQKSQEHALILYEERGSYVGNRMRTVDEYVALSQEALDERDLDSADYWVTRALILEPFNEAALLAYVDVKQALQTR